MASCKDCVHADMCRFYTKELAKAKGITLDKDIFEYFSSGDVCEDFKDRSRFVELDKEADSDRAITLDDAIAHCYEVADGADDSMCNSCRAEHMMLAAWLCELKMRREQELQKPLGIGDGVEGA